MEERVSRTISKLASWDQLASIEKNASERGQLTSEISAALNKRSAELARAYISEKTGLNLAQLSSAEDKIIQAVSEYVAIMRRQGKYPGRTLEQLKNRGLLGAAEVAVCKRTASKVDSLGEPVA